MVLKLCDPTLMRRFNFPRASYKSKRSVVLFIKLITVKVNANNFTNEQLFFKYSHADGR